MKPQFRRNKEEIQKLIEEDANMNNVESDDDNKSDIDIEK